MHFSPPPAVVNVALRSTGDLTSTPQFKDSMCFI